MTGLVDIMFCVLLACLVHTVQCVSQGRITSNGCTAGTKPVYRVGFDNWKQNTPYDSNRLRADFKTESTNHMFKRSRIVPGYRGNGLEITHPAKCVGSSCTLWFQAPVPKSNEVLLSFKLKVQDGFTWVKGGKLPGVCGGACNTGFKTSSGYDGFSSRLMWREGGAIVSYAYHPGQRFNYGDDFPWGRRLVQGKWVRLSQRIVLNTPGKNDGVLEGFVGDTRVYGKYDVSWRKTSRLSIESFQFTTFFGGDSMSWAPRSQQTMIFDDILVCA